MNLHQRAPERASIQPSSLEILALGDRFAAAYTSIEHALRTLGRLTFRREHSFESADAVVDFIRDSPFELVIMPNPYGNSRRMYVYQKLRAVGFPVLVFDRGGLPNSWFFDIGFNADSPSYSPLSWDQPLDADQRTSVRDYISSVISSDVALETQGDRVGGEELRKELSLEGKQVLFVPFQRPGDTTMRHFAGNVKDAQEFTLRIEQVQGLLASVSDDWVVICKKHPLETKLPSRRLQFVPDDTHIHDLLELASAVALVNSGTGLLATLFDKPVYHFGQTYYEHPRLNRSVQTADALVHALLHAPVHFDPDVRDRLIFHLVNRVYSFGKFETELVEEKDGALRNITRHIDFTELRFPEDVFKKKNPAFFT